MVGWLIILLMKYVFFNEITTWKFLVHIALYTQTGIFLHPKRKKNRFMQKLQEITTYKEKYLNQIQLK